MSEANSNYLSRSDYLRLEECASLRHEFVNGKMIAMSGSTDAHSIIVMNLSSILHLFLRGSGCRVYTNDMKVFIDEANCFFYPDIMVTCEPVSKDAVFKTAPKLIIEVLSKSTKRNDRNEKFAAYKQLPSLLEYVLVHQDRISIEAFCRNLDEWNLTEFKAGDALVLHSIKGFSTSLAEIYLGLDLPTVLSEEELDYQL